MVREFGLILYALMLNNGKLVVLVLSQGSICDI